MMVIVPNFVDEAINKALDEKLRDAPEAARESRGHLYRGLLAYYNEHGALPEFEIVKNAKGDEER